MVIIPQESNHSASLNLYVWWISWHTLIFQHVSFSTRGMRYVVIALSIFLSFTHNINSHCGLWRESWNCSPRIGEMIRENRKRGEVVSLCWNLGIGGDMLCVYVQWLTGMIESTFMIERYFRHKTRKKMKDSGCSHFWSQLQVYCVNV